MRKTERWAALGAGLLLTTALTACNGGGGTDVESDPEAALSEAIEAIGDYDGVELTLSLDGDRDAIVASADDLDEDTADLLLSSSVLLRAAGEDEEDAQAELVVTLRDEEAIEVRILPEERFFLRVDVDAMAAGIDEPEFTDGVEEALGAAQAFGLGEVAEAVRAGDWIELTGTQQLAELAGGGSTTDDEPSEEEVEDVRERIVAAFQRFIDQDVAVTYVGEESAGERVTAATTAGALASLFDEIGTIASDLSGVDTDALGAEMPGDENDDTPVEIDFWLDGGELQQVGYDLSQVEGEETPPEGTYILVTIDEFTGSVEAPDETTEIDVFAIMNSVFSGMGGMGMGDDGFEEDGFADDGSADDGFEEGELEGDDAGDPQGGMCFTEEEIDEMVGGDEETRAEFDQAIEMGLIEVC